MKTITTHFISTEMIYKKEIEEIQELYSEVIDNITKINRVFGITDPIDIYTLFSYELKNGYLSRNKHFEYVSSEIKNIKTLYGANPITGKSVCRHIAAMLRDIYKKSGITSNTVNVYIKDNEEKPKEQLKIERRYGNHVITLAINNGKVHLLDGTLYKIYKPKSKKYIIDKESKQLKLCIDEYTFSGTEEEFKNQKHYLKFPKTSFEEDQKRIEKMESLFDNNQDIFEILYNTNKPIYKEISHKIMLFKK